MRDVRLEQHRANGGFDRRQHAAHTAAEQYAEADAVVVGLAKWCRDVLFADYLIDAGDRGYGLTALAAALSANYPEPAFRCVSDTARRQSLESGFTALIERREHCRRDGLSVLFGRALAHALGHLIQENSPPISGLLRTLWHLAWSDELLGHSFVESLRELVHRSSSVRCTILAILETRIDEINTDPGVGVSVSDRAELRAVVDEWRSNPAIDRLWQHQFGRFRDDLLDLTAELLPAARTAVLGRLDRLGFPHPIDQVLLHTPIRHDREEIAAILKDAPPCSQDGQLWNGRLLALLALRAVDDHCDLLWRAIRQAGDSDSADAQVMNTVKDTLVPWFEQLGRIVMDRPDGRFLGAQWLFKIGADERMNRPHHERTAQRHDEPLPREDLIEWVAHSLSNAGLTVKTTAALVDFPGVPAPDRLASGRRVARHNDAANPRVGALVAMCLLDQLNPSVRDRGKPDHLDLLDGLLAFRDSAFELEATMNLGPHDLPASCFGYLVANAVEPPERWRQSWDLLVEQRRRVQHWSKTMDDDALAPSLFLLAVGTSGVARLLSPSHGCPDKARRLWRQLFEQARECWLTMSLSPAAESIERHIHELFCWHPMVFGDSATPENESELGMTRAAKDYSELLADDLDLLGGDDLMLTICCLNAYRNGVSPAIMNEGLRRNSGRIGKLVRQFERWQEFEGKVRRRPGITTEIAKLKADIERNR